MLLPLSNIKYIVIHYSATPPERTVTVEDIHGWHRARGWKGFGYHGYGPRAGAVYIDHAADSQVRELSALGFEAGAQSGGENEISVGYCYEGGLVDHDRALCIKGGDTRTPGQKRAMIEWIDHVLSLTGGDGVDAAKGPIVLGHKDMPGAATQCPGFDAGAWWAGVVEGRETAPKVSVRYPWLEALQTLAKWMQGRK